MALQISSSPLQVLSTVLQQLGVLPPPSLACSMLAAKQSCLPQTRTNTLALLNEFIDKSYDLQERCVHPLQRILRH